MPVVCLRSAVCLLGRFPALAGADLDVDAGRDRAALGAERRGQDRRCCGCCAGLVPLRSGEATVLGHDLAVDRRGVRRELALVGHETFCYDDLTVRENLRFAARARGRPVAAADAALERLGLDDGRRRSCTAGSRPGSGAGSRSRSRSPATRGCCCSTSRTPGSTPTGRELLDEVVAAAPAEGRTRAARLARARPRPRASRTREVRVVAGRVPTVVRAPPTAPVTTPIAGAEAARVSADDRSGVRRGLVAGKDLRIERRSRVALQQIAPFGAIVLLLFAFALDPDRGAPAPRRARPVLGGGAARGAARGRPLVRDRGRERRARRPAALGSRRRGASSSARPPRSRSQLLVLEVVLGDRRGRALRRRGASAWSRSCRAALAATVGVAATGTVYGVLAGGLRPRETLVPLLVLPVVAPVMLGATRAFEAALDGTPSEAWPWVQLLAVFAVLVRRRSGCPGLRAAPGGVMSTSQRLERGRRRRGSAAASCSRSR